MSDSTLIDLLRGAQRAGPVTGLELDGQRAVLVTGAEETRALLVDGSARFTKRSHRARVLLGDGLISVSGEPWKRQRRRLQGYFTGVGLRECAPHITAAARRTADRWAGLAARDGATTDVGEDMQFFALDAIWRVLTGRELDPETSRRLATIDDVVAALPTMGTDPATDAGLAERLAGIEEVAREVVAAAREAPAAGRGILHDLLDPALADACGPYSEDLVRDELVTLVVAGYETTATALTWLHLLLAAHPQWRAWALDSGAPGTPQRHRALQALISETLRLYPPVWLLPRHAETGGPLGGYAVEPGTRVLACPYLAQRDAERVPDPDAFDPTRFTGGARPAHDTHLPFGLGPRVCLGRQFALLEMETLLEALLPHHVPDFGSPLPGAVFAATLRPRGPLTAVIRPADADRIFTRAEG
ncbi:cytochrome P450 [Streptomyces sp. ST1015]|uniref:cytochrome P450 n=1 Tax=unclassified Streptomyces TaxID=2593676 RepID=UPI001CA6B56B|nr:cytochrome P450 [Streptomyces sp. ST1015]QZZ25381.1 cytochrome P450 [Streptomyces sp. ST1015]